MGLEAKWTPAEDAGSLRFSKQYRDAVGENYEQWLEPEPDPSSVAVAVAALEELTGVPAWQAVAAAATTLACMWVARRWAVPAIRQAQSDRMAASLLTEEERAAAAAAAGPADIAAAAAAGQGPDAGPLERVCRFCDVAVGESYVDSHVNGKRHGKMRAEHIKFGADPEAVWAWRPVAASAEGGSAPALS